ncbi:MULTISPECIES: 1-(5-phosphoribosyl)-5-[(5-phosphoribosylamino)methylideneamino]imidazole-4-carboxamide isomerase [Bacillus cereus group]|jgi:phosphoribosylformimino-5-aminoimidazole carboxamide ribotide isomerase|uniref:1-(5-phosphoribosyl)-5-[(5-phosphoribosylamino)methylideneamino] imidazole-4-carboxamide isomerase n=1 Tax=Bacillus cereus TaxID=1396 RepID=A0AAW4QM57_BACCE|nr:MULTISPECIES: 1-(5-phosphoribosyl)-5-[(5-phosphoribosylamino)methylideneamino]imidazole-4-carboxamide isomerase [Bacillus cereus group]MBE5092747.1 1-(5-phosphoribosyl)-5-[(5-phosphoribosylamino)methylideneamino]imidazole-4-carboxamide isomerase [Bacillus thuringiensis]MBY0034987.1 1-(5-phosphoribosyl)-5-[(5-phosphoribosylamino)methylideneamino]imidazole-4-carboxamide isomerase [Bacillus cereus]PDY78732.1 1-(5-phosphoribosyl)-5-[(5-phosphoribosylamino)methylideneamino]imidazole-4-carboxamide 
MEIFPAIDLKEGRCVRLYQGEFSKETVMNEDPVAQAIIFEKLGAEILHIVDLDGAIAGESLNLPVIEKICKAVRIPVQVGGGIRSLVTVEKLLSAGVEKVILGTAALYDNSFLEEAVRLYKEKIIVGIDAKNGFVATRGWLDLSEISYVSLAKQMESLGVQTIVFTDISKDGTLAGPNFEQLAILQKSVGIRLIASGGVASIQDVKKLNDMNIYGVIIGKALYEKTIDLEEVLQVTKLC